MQYILPPILCRFTRLEEFSVLVKGAQMADLLVSFALVVCIVYGFNFLGLLVSALDEEHLSFPLLWLWGLFPFQYLYYYASTLEYKPLK